LREEEAILRSQFLFLDQKLYIGIETQNSHNRFYNYTLQDTAFRTAGDHEKRTSIFLLFYFLIPLEQMLVSLTGTLTF
jgi:hypothetical protein